MTETRFLLSEHNNRHAPLRSNGVRWWGQPGRNKPITCVAIHTAETPATSSSARSVAEWQSRAPVPSSYHILVDSTTTMRTVNDRDTAFHVASNNSYMLGLSFATRAHDWNVNRRWDDLALRRAAVVARQWQALYRIPARWLTRPEAMRGMKGFVRHSTMDPARRSDPGLKFPAVRFFELLADPGSGEGDDVYVVRQGEEGARVVRAQKVLQAAGVAAGEGDLLPRFGPDGGYGGETAAAVDVMAARAGLPSDGDTGMDVLVLDYCRNWLSEPAGRGTDD